MSPWLFVIAPIVAVIFPWTIPFVLAFAIYQWSEGGTKPRTLIEARRRWNDTPEGQTAEAAADRGPLLTDEELEEQIELLVAIAEPRPLRNIGTCPACAGTIARSGRRWTHTAFDHLCADPAPTPMEGVTL